MQRQANTRRNHTSAWGNEDTQQLIDILGEYGVKATFFVVGEWVDKYPESVKALHEAGHEVMNHSDTHAHLSQLSQGEITADLNACSDKIEAVTGVRPTLVRPPYGEYDDHVISAIRAMGMEPIQWDVDSLDWKDLSAGEITQRVLDKVCPGSRRPCPASSRSCSGRGTSSPPCPSSSCRGSTTPTTPSTTPAASARRSAKSRCCFFPGERL